MAIIDLIVIGIQYIGGTLLAGMLLYGASRLIATAYFKSKRESELGHTLPKVK